MWQIQLDDTVCLENASHACQFGLEDARNNSYYLWIDDGGLATQQRGGQFTRQFCCNTEVARVFLCEDVYLKPAAFPCFNMKFSTGDGNDDLLFVLLDG
jgi:hypothetical protein